MSRRRSAPPPDTCKQCRVVREWDEIFYRDLCRTCREQQAAQRRKTTAANALAKAKPSGTVVRDDGHTYTVVTLPPKRRGGNRH